MEKILIVIGFIITLVSSFLLGRGTKYDKSGNSSGVVSNLQKPIDEVSNLGEEIASSSGEAGDIAAGIDEAISGLSDVRNELTQLQSEIGSSGEQSNRAEELIAELFLRLREKPSENKDI